MGANPRLIVMLTHNDRTVENAAKVFEEAKNSKAQFWGFKEIGIPRDEAKQLFSYMKQCGKTTVLEVVEYTEMECVLGAEMAAECGVDILMGTCYFDSVNKICLENNIKYMPFVGHICGRPSVLTGDAAEMIEEAQAYLQRGVFGIDLLGYRFEGDGAALNRQFVKSINAPVCLAGSVNGFNRLDEIKACSPWGFTIGGAFFENKFGDGFAQQINIVCDYINKK